MKGNEMKIISIIIGIVCAALWCGAETIGFDSEGDFTSNFVVIEEGAAGTTTWTTGIGVGGTSGRIDLAGITTASGEGIYTTNSVDPDDGAITASFYFLASAYTNTDVSRIALGLSPDQVNLRASSEVQVRLIKNGDTNATFEVRDGGNGTVSGNTFTEVTTTGVTLTDNHWYKLSATFSPYGSGSMEVDTTLVDYGTDGATMGATIATAHAARVAPADFSDAGDRLPLHIGILAQDEGGGAVALDDVYVPWVTEILPVPETTIPFDTSAELTNNFVVNDSGAAGSVVYSSAIGVGGSNGRVDTSVPGSSGKGLYTKETADPDDGAITASFYFLASEFSTTDDSRIALGLSPDMDNLVGNNEVQVRLIKNGDTNALFEVRADKTDSDGDMISTSGVVLEDNHWYKMEATFSAWGSGSMEVVGSIVDYGLDGITLGSTIATVKAGKTVDANFLNAGDRLPLSIGILAQNDGGGAVAIDNVDAPFFTNVVVVLTPYEEWANNWIVDIGALTNDYDSDGLDNLLEYALNGNPTNDDAAAVSPVGYIGSESGTNYLYYVHNERTDDNSLTYSVGTETNLVGTLAWNTNDVSFVSESSVSNSFKTVTNRTEATAPSKFIGLTVQK